MNYLDWIGKIKYRIEPQGDVKHWYYFSGFELEYSNSEPKAPIKDYHSDQTRELMHGNWLAASSVPVDLRKRFYRGILLALPDVEAIAAKLVATLARERTFKHELLAEFAICLLANADNNEVTTKWAMLKVCEGGWMPSALGGVPTMLRTWRLETRLGRFEVDRPETESPGVFLEERLASQLAELDERYGPMIEPMLAQIVARFEPGPR